MLEHWLLEHPIYDKILGLVFLTIFAWQLYKFNKKYHNKKNIAMADKDKIKDEHMEEDLNKEIQRFSMNLAEQENGGEWLHDIMKTARHFAEWQRQQMEKKHSIEIASNCMRNYEEGKAAGYERGCKDTKEQMMANAIEAEVQSAGCFIPLITPKEYGDKIPNIKFGDTIKVILVKE